MKTAVSNIAWTEGKDENIYNVMKKYGYSGLEIAPTRVFPEYPYRRISEAAEWAKELKRKYGFEIPSMQSIWFGHNEKLFGSEEERKILLDYTKQAIDFANAIGCRNLVFGCPRNRNYVKEEETDIAVMFFRELGEYAVYRGTVIGMEANPVIYHTNYINDTSSALNLIRQVDSKGFLLNLDLGAMIQNQEDVSELVGQVEYISHVHISEPGLKPIEKRKIHRELKKILMEENYSGFVSVEMRKTDNVAVIENSLQYVGEIYL